MRGVIMELYDYEDFIVTNGFVDEGRKGYYSFWVKKILKAGISKKLPERERINQFIKYLQFEKKYPQCQVKQAGEAVELYLNLFLNRKFRTEKLKDLPDAERIMQTFIEMIRLKHYSYRTEETYRHWILRYLEYCIQMNFDYRNSSSVKHFLTSLAVKKQVAASTQNQAFNAILFMFKYILRIPLEDIKGTVRAKGKKRLPVVLSEDEVRALFATLSGTRKLILELIYGCGLRISELIRL
jgi:site-specific recombinase XerD